MLRTLFFVEIAVDEASRQYVARVTSLAEKKQITMVMPSMRFLIPRLKKVLLQKDKQIRCFPLPEESRIIVPNKKDPANVLVLPNGN